MNYCAYTELIELSFNSFIWETLEISLYNDKITTLEQNKIRFFSIIIVSPLHPNINMHIVEVRQANITSFILHSPYSFLVVYSEQEPVTS